MEGSVIRFLKAEWKVSDTGSAHWASSLLFVRKSLARDNRSFAHSGYDSKFIHFFNRSYFPLRQNSPLLWKVIQNLNARTTCEFSICYKMILWFFTRCKFFVFSIALTKNECFSSDQWSSSFFKKIFGNKMCQAAHK